MAVGNGNDHSGPPFNPQSAWFVCHSFSGVCTDALLFAFVPQAAPKQIGLEELDFSGSTGPSYLWRSLMSDLWLLMSEVLLCVAYDTTPHCMKGTVVGRDEERSRALLVSG
jgi:hypothetical protein